MTEKQKAVLITPSPSDEQQEGVDAPGSFPRDLKSRVDYRTQAPSMENSLPPIFFFSHTATITIFQGTTPIKARHLLAQEG